MLSRHYILQTLSFRFTVSEANRQTLVQQLEVLTDEAQLERLFTAAVQSPSIEVFHDEMRQVLSN
jgi:uncharacterized protein VirK/YbjX